MAIHVIFPTPYNIGVDMKYILQRIFLTLFYKMYFTSNALIQRIVGFQLFVPPRDPRQLVFIQYRSKTISIKSSQNDSYLTKTKLSNEVNIIKCQYYKRFLKLDGLQNGNVSEGH